MQKRQGFLEECGSVSTTSGQKIQKEFGMVNSTIINAMTQHLLFYEIFGEMEKEVLVLFEDWGDKIIIYFEKSKLFRDYF